MIKNILLTGKPGIGKTRLIKEIVKERENDFGGFYTFEIREKGKRVGFEIATLEGERGILAHENFKGPKVSKYKVNLEDLEEIGVKSILRALESKKVIVIDEIGKMELLSPRFRDAVLAALNSNKKVLATIKESFDPFTSQIKERKDTKVFHLDFRNKERIKKEILNLFD